MRVVFLVMALVSLGTGCASSTPARDPAAPSHFPPPSGATDSPAPPPSKVSGAGEACAGLTGLACAPGLYCEFAPEAMCGAADQTGVCAAMPEMCTEEYDPVCGCNDKTYSNACHAARDGVSVVKKGECAAQPGDSAPALAEGATCGTRGVPGDCAAGFYCAFRQNCGVEDTGGVCTKRTEICTKEFRPVCGCDGKTYGNACTAASAGVSVASQGSCPPAK